MCLLASGWIINKKYVHTHTHAHVQGLQEEDPDTADIPLWKKALQRKRFDQIELEMEREKLQQQEAEAAYKVCVV